MPMPRCAVDCHKSVQKPEAALEGIGKNRWFDEQAHDNEGFVREIKKISRMDEHVFCRQQVQDENVFGTRRRYAYCRAPAALSTQHLTGRIPLRDRVRTGQIVANALVDRRAYRRSLQQ